MATVYGASATIGAPQPLQADVDRWAELAQRAALDFATPLYLSRWTPVLHATQMQERYFASNGVSAQSWLSFKTHPVLPLAWAWLQSGRGVEVVSEAEFAAVLGLGSPGARLLVNGVAKHSWLGRYHSPGLSVHFDSPREVEVLLPAAISQKWRVGLRCHVPSECDARDRRFGGQFGLTDDEADAACRRLRLAGVDVVGLHFHLGQAARGVGAYAESMASLVATCHRNQLHPTYFDCGGGIDNAADVQGAFAEIADAFNDATRRVPSLRELWLENGRLLTRESAILAVTVLDTKERGESRYLICDGGRTNQALDADNGMHRVQALPARGGPMVLTTICGPTCMTDDQLGRMLMPSSVAAGDLIVWFDAGAYHLPWETRFSHGLSAIVWGDETDCLSLARGHESAEKWEPVVDIDVMTVHDPASDIKGNFCRFADGQLARPFDPEPPSPLTHFVHDAFRALVLNDRFSCVGGRSAVKRDAYRFALYDRMGSPAASRGLGLDLSRFVEDTDLSDEPLTAFVASFVEPLPVSEQQFEQLLWSTLQQVHDIDTGPWEEGRRSDPSSPEFSYSFGGTGFFIVGLHAGSSRLARRFAWPTLIFNPHRQFDRLRAEGQYQKFQAIIRTRDVALQGTLNPMLSNFGDKSEARQYSGRSVAEDWRCPFSAAHSMPRLDGQD